MSQTRQRRISINSPQTIEEDAELNTTGYRLRNPLYKHSLKSTVDLDNTDVKMALKPAESSSDSEEDKEIQANGCESAEGTPAQEGEENTAKELAATGNTMPLKTQPNRLLQPNLQMISNEDWKGKNHTHKLDTVFESINKLYVVYEQVSQRIHPLEVAVFDKTDGILPQLQSLADYAKESDTRVDSLMKENANLKEELEVVKGLLYKQSKQISAIQGRQTNQMARSMSDNIIVSGLIGDYQEAVNTDALSLISTFLEESLELTFNREDIMVVHWMGQYVKDRDRSIILKVCPNLRKKILDNTSKLAKKLNEKGKPYSVNVQLPEMLAEQKREIQQIIKEKKDAEASLDNALKSKILVKNNKVFINGQLQRKLLKPPTVAQIFEISEEEKTKMKAIKIKYTQPKSLRSSEFMGAACVVNSMNEVHLAYRKLFLKFPGADHIMAGFSCEGKQGYQDDSEFSSGFRILNVIKDSRFTNVAVFIIQEYGGLHLGPNRFNMIKEMAEEALQQIF